MMRKIYNFTFLMMALFIFGACEGEKGEIGPDGLDGEKGEQGEQGEPGQDGEDGFNYEISGFIKGTLEGTRKDGVAFTEAIEFTEKINNEGFEKEGDFHNLIIRRYLANDAGYYNSASFNLSIYDLNGTPKVNSKGMWVEVEKELEGNKLFRLYSQFYGEETTTYYPINRNNTDYEFLNGGADYEYLYENNTSYRIFTLTDGSKVKYEDAWENYNQVDGYNYGAFVSLTTTDGTVITTGTKYANLEFRSDEYRSFYENGINLGEKLVIPADTYEINNFIYNTETSTVTFDFIYNINGGRDSYQNTSDNDLTFTGSVEAEVYSEIVSK